MKLWEQLGRELENIYAGGKWPSPYYIASSRLDALLVEGGFDTSYKDSDFVYNGHRTLLKRFPIGVGEEKPAPCCGSSWVDWT